MHVWAMGFRGASRALQPLPMGCLVTHEMSVGHAVGRVPSRDALRRVSHGGSEVLEGGNGWRVLLDGVMGSFSVGFTIRSKPMQRPPWAIETS